MNDKYIDFCMTQIEFWERKMSEAVKENQRDEMLIEIDEVLKSHSTERLNDLYHQLREMRNNGEIDDSKHREYLKYLSTGKVA